MSKDEIHLKDRNALLAALHEQRWPDFLIEALLTATTKTEELQKRLLGVNDISLLHLAFQTYPCGEKGFMTRMLNHGMEDRPGHDWDLFVVQYMHPEDASEEELSSVNHIGLLLEPDADTCMDGTAWNELPPAGGIETVTNRYAMWLHWVCCIQLFTGAEVRVFVDTKESTFIARAMINGMYLMVYHSHSATMRMLERQRLVNSVQTVNPTTKSVN